MTADRRRSVQHRDSDFVAAIDRERPLLHGTARLLLDNPRTVDPVLDSVLAHLYGRDVPPAALRFEAVRGLVSGHQPDSLPWSQSAVFELVDGPVSSGSVREPILSDLARLTREQRTAIVLERYTQLPSGQIAGLLGRPVDQVSVLARQAQAALSVGRPHRTSDQTLADELRTAAAGTPVGSGRDDLIHGRRLSRRRLLRRGAGVAAALVVLVVLAAQLRPTAVPTANSPVPATASPSITLWPATPSPEPTCDVSVRPCQAAILRDWRHEMGLVISDRLDREKRYFTGYSFSYDRRYETPGIWTRSGGSLGLEMFRLDSGATEVYLQIATSRKAAVRCGTTTDNECVSIRFMDGNRFIMTDTTSVADGLEVQYSPIDDQVITVIARNTTRGQKLALNRGDLIDLVQDPRLRLPPI